MKHYVMAKGNNNVRICSLGCVRKLLLQQLFRAFAAFFFFCWLALLTV